MAIRFGIVGAGAIARLSCRDIASHADARFVAAADPDATRLGELAAQFAIPNTYADAEQLFARDDVDAVYIGVPNLYHAPLAIAALKQGKHVLLDKPFAFNLQQAKDVAAAAAATRQIFMLGMNQRFLRSSQRLRALVQAGTLGEIYHIKAYWRRRAGIPRIGSWFGNRAISGGGALLDIGVHVLDLALFAAGNFAPLTVSGATYTKFGNRGLGDGTWGLSDRSESVFDADDFTSAFVRLAGGTSLTLDAAWAGHQESANDMDVVLYGTDAAASASGEKLFRNGDTRGEYQVVQNPAAKVAYPHANRFHHFINVVLGREAPCIAVAESLAVQAILDGIYESGRNGREVVVEGAL